MSDTINRQDAIDALIRESTHDGSYGYIDIKSAVEAMRQLSSAELVKAYTKADYIMALHKEYGCTLTRAEKAHDKALEYLRSKARMKG